MLFRSPQMASIGRRRSQTASQQLSRAVTARASPFVDDDDDVPWTAKRRKLSNKLILSGSAEKPITFSDSEDDGAMPTSPPNTEESLKRQTHRPRMQTHEPRARVATPPSIFNNPSLDLDELAAGYEAPTPGPAQTSGWTAVNTTQPQSANTIMAQLPIVGRGRVKASPSPAAHSRAATPRQPRVKKTTTKKVKQHFVIDLTADSDDDSAAMSRKKTINTVSRQVTPYVPVDNSAWMGMMFTKSRNGGLDGVVDESALLGMNMDVEMRGMEELRRFEGGGGEVVVKSVERQEAAQVVYGY